MYTLPSAPLSIGGVIDDGIRLYRSTFSRTWLLALAFSLAIAAFSIFFLLSIPNYGVPGKQSALRMLGFMRSPLVAGLYLALLLTKLASYGSLLKLQSTLAHADSSLTLGQALAAGFRRLPGMVLATLLTFLAVLAGLILLIIPGIWLWGRLLLWMAPMFSEDASALDSLRASWELTRGNWWRATTILAVAAVMLLAVSGVLGGVGGGVAALLHVDLVDRTIILQLIAGFVTLLIYPLVTALWLAMYHDFKLRREGGDLAARVGALTSA